MKTQERPVVALHGEEAISKCLSILADGGWLELRQGRIYAVNSEEDWRIELGIYMDLFRRGYIKSHESEELDRFVITDKGKQIGELSDD